MKCDVREIVNDITVTERQNVLKHACGLNLFVRYITTLSVSRRRMVG
jgi:hypothetical protein